MMGTCNKYSSEKAHCFVTIQLFGLATKGACDQVILLYKNMLKMGIQVGCSAISTRLHGISKEYLKTP